MKPILSPGVVAPLLAAAALTVAGSALADPDCNTLPGSTYVTGSSAVKPFMAGLGKALSATTTVIYKGQGSCVGVDAILNSTKITGTASYWDSTGAEKTCNLDPAGVVADVGVSDVFATSCPMVAALPAGVGDFFGPNQVMELVVPTASSQASISAQAAYFVLGFGAAGKVTPWIDESQLFVRSPTSGTQQMIARAITVPAEKWKGLSQASSGAVLTAVSASVSPEAALGILAADVADANRDKVKTLAFEAFKQNCGYWPDSSATSFDKRNVRDGHYPIWGPLHFFAKVGANNVPTKPDAANLIGYFTGKVPTPAGINLLDLEVSAHTVPACAMKVQRSTELGDVSAFTPAEPCGCYFESKLNGNTPATGCTACTKDAECGGTATHCRYGYCEAN